MSELSVLSLKFFCKSGTVLKKIFYFKVCWEELRYSLCRMSTKCILPAPSPVLCYGPPTASLPHRKLLDPMLWSLGPFHFGILPLLGGLLVAIPEQIWLQIHINSIIWEDFQEPMYF